MLGDAAASSLNDVTELDRWTARKVQPIVAFYVLAVFAAFIALSIFIFHSREAVKALVMAAVGAVAATVPGMIEKVEYRLTSSGVEKRPVNRKKPRQYENVFRWDELSRVKPMRHGFKYSKTMIETNPLRRFWDAHISDRFSGEVHVEKKDLERVLDLVERRGVATR